MAQLRIAISYAYVERPNTRRNLEFFLQHGLDSSVALLSIVVKGGRPSDGAGAGGPGGCTVEIPEAHRGRVRVTFAEENVGYDMESHRRNAALFAELEEKKRKQKDEGDRDAAGAGDPESGESLFTHFVAMNDSAMGPFCRQPPTSTAAEEEEKEEDCVGKQSEKEEEEEEEGPGPGPWHRLFAERLVRLRSHPPTCFVATIRHFSYFLFFSRPGWHIFAGELRRRTLISYRDAADVEAWLGREMPHDCMYPDAKHWDCPHTPWDVVFVKENRVGRKKTDTAGTSDRLSDVTPEELEAAAAAVRAGALERRSVCAAGGGESTGVYESLTR